MLACLIGTYGIYKAMKKERRTKKSKNLKRTKVAQDREVDKKRKSKINKKEDLDRNLLRNRMKLKIRRENNR